MALKLHKYNEWYTSQIRDRRACQSSLFFWYACPCNSNIESIMLSFPIGYQPANPIQFEHNMKIIRLFCFYNLWIKQDVIHWLMIFIAVKINKTCSIQLVDNNFYSSSMVTDIGDIDGDWVQLHSLSSLCFLREVHSFSSDLRQLNHIEIRHSAFDACSSV